MKAFIDGKVIELTEEQIEEFNKVQVPQIITDKQRISALESAFADLAIMLVGGAENDWVYQNTI